MSDIEYAKAMADFLSKKNVTRCPTVCVAATRANVGDADRAALRNYDAAREAARQARTRDYQQMMLAS